MIQYSSKNGWISRTVKAIATHSCKEKGTGGTKWRSNLLQLLTCSHQRRWIWVSFQNLDWSKKAKRENIKRMMCSVNVTVYCSGKERSKRPKSSVFATSQEREGKKYSVEVSSCVQYINILLLVCLEPMTYAYLQLTYPPELSKYWLWGELRMYGFISRWGV